MNRSSRRWLLILLIALFPAAAFAESDEAVLRAIQKKYDATRTFRARFVQESFLKIMDQAQKAVGTVIIKKPGKMKWVYQAPDPQVLVSNDRWLWLYLPEEEQVTKMPVESIYSSNTPALFLAGEGKLAESFRVREVRREADRMYVELVPREADQKVERLVLIVSSNNSQIIGSRVYDKLGNRTEILFENIESNPNLSDQEFQFQVPPGVELIDLSSTNQQ